MLFFHILLLYKKGSALRRSPYQEGEKKDAESYQKIFSPIRAAHDGRFHDRIPGSLYPRRMAVLL